MSVDLSVIIRTDFRERDKEEATLKKLEETAAILNKSEGTTSYLVDTDDSFDRWCIRDLSEGHFFIELWLFNGFWHMETSFGYHQYFTRTMGIRKTIYGYAMLLGQKDVWPCEEYYTWNSGILEEPTRTFEEWKEYCVDRIKHEIKEYDAREILERKDYYYDGDGVRHDTFEDYHKKKSVYNEHFSGYTLLEMNKIAPIIYLQKDSKKYLVNTDTLEFVTGGPIDAYDMLDTSHYSWVKKDKLTAILSPEGKLVSDFMKAHFYSNGDYEEDRQYHEYIRDLDSDFVMEI